MGQHLRLVGIGLMIAGVVLFLAKAGFPPSFKTTYEYTPTGVKETTSPSTAVVVISVLLILGGTGLERVGKRNRAAAR